MSELRLPLNCDHHTQRVQHVCLVQCMRWTCFNCGTSIYFLFAVSLACTPKHLPDKKTMKYDVSLMRTMLSEWAKRTVLSQPPAQRINNISRFRTSRLVLLWLKTWISTELPWLQIGFNHQATVDLLSYIWVCHYRAEVQKNCKGMWWSGLERVRGNRVEQG